jgi:D-glycero-alpha-D-manno-heptose 1-phosphate guanylyltransferase
MEAIVLAGGLGTRLRSVVDDRPKAMAQVAGRPFLAHLLDQLAAFGFDSAVLAVGYRAEQIRAYFGASYRRLALRYSVEDTPLGTGGAIVRAMAGVTAPEVFVVNGDTFVDLDYRAMWSAHEADPTAMTVAVHAVPDAGRYGALDLDGQRIRGFLEKGRSGPGWINAGVYLLSRGLLDPQAVPTRFSFESDFLVPRVRELRPLTFRTDGVFIDIGIPEDYARAQTLLAEASRGAGGPAS